MANTTLLGTSRGVAPPTRPTRATARLRRVALACGLALGIAAITGPMPIEAAFAAATAQQNQAPAAHEQRADQFAADALSSFVLQLVRGPGEPTPRVYERVALGMAAAAAITPNDPELIRLELQAWDSAGDLERATATAERLLRLDPQDTVAQLRVLNARIRRLPNADARLAVYDRVLRAGAEGRGGIPEEVRSRLALDAALLAREVDPNEIRFIDYLTTATSLDVSNKQAAALFAAYFLDQTTDPGERIDLMTNLVLADPFDPISQQSLAGELLRYGAYAGAKRWFTIVRLTRQANGLTGDEDLSFNAFLCIWNDEGPLALREVLQSLRRELLVSMARQRARLESLGEDPGPERPPILPYRLELLSLGIDVALRDAPRIEQSVRFIESWASLTRLQLRESGNQMLAEEQDEDRRRAIEAAAANAEASLDVELLYAYLLSGLELDRAEALLNALVEQRDQEEAEQAGDEAPDSLAAVLDERAERRFRGWLAKHRGLADEALERLTPLAEEGDAGARLALGALAERRRQPEEAQLHYARLVQADPSTMLTAIALTRLENMLGKPVSPTRLQTSLNESALSVAPWLESAITDPRLISALSARFTNATIGPLERPEVEIRLRNAARIPLGVGEDRPIGSSLLLLPRLSVPNLPSEQQAAVSRIVSPEVVSAARRLRLQPNEEIVIRVNAGRGLTGRTMRQMGGFPVNLRQRVLQAFRIADDGSFAEGPLSSASQTDILTRTAIDLRESAEVLSDRLRFADGDDLLSDLYAAMFRLNLADASVPEGEQMPAAQQRERDTLRSALLERAERLSPSEARFLAALAMQFLPMTDDWGNDLRAALSGINDPMTDLLLIIASRAERDDAAYDTLMARDDAAGAFATALREMRTIPDAESESPESIEGQVPGATAP